jgi:hypothetical protein
VSHDNVFALKNPAVPNEPTSSGRSSGRPRSATSTRMRGASPRTGHRSVTSGRAADRVAASRAASRDDRRRRVVAAWTAP